MQSQTPQPDPALKRLERFVGTWAIKGRTLGSNVDNITAKATFEWLPGGFFLKQSFEADFAGMKIQSLELIGYDPDLFPPVYDNAYVIGTVSEKAARETGLSSATAVVCGTVDGAAATLEAGAVDTGDAVEMTGTSTVLNI
jgi:ribulose kinase